MLKNKFLKLPNWDNFIIHTKPTILTKELLEIYLNKFWNEIIEPKVSENQHILLLFRLQWSDNQFVTIGNLQRLNNNDKDYILDFLLDEIKDRGDYYLETSIISIVFSYGIRDGKAPEKGITSSAQHHFYQHHKLPITMDPLNYGNLIYKKDNVYINQVNDKNSVVITQHDNHNEIEYYRSGSLVYKWTDKWIDKENNIFRRILGRKEFTFKNNELFLFKSEKTAKFIANLSRNEEILNKFITLDIETYLDNKIHIPYCISWYDGELNYTYYLSDYNSSIEMIKASIKDIMVKKYDNYKVYIHNMAGFDAIFLLKILADLGYVKPIIHNNDIISIQFNLKSYSIQFKDSNQLLITSLRKLAQAFGVETQKSIFPYKFVNKDNLDYIGTIPDFKYFDDISSIDYNCYIENYNIWSMREETVKYCEIDCISLYQIIIKFNELIFEHFNLNIHKYPTVSSLAFAIFRNNFMKEENIPQLSGQIAKDIRQGYTGGAVDMYIPRPPKGTKIYCYDVNALYPYIMQHFDMPIGKPTLFEGDIRAIEPNAFGFFYCNITAPDNLKHPIIQTHVKINNMTRTIAPLGQWSDMIFSSEMDNAIKFGYKFEILWGYTFERKNLFKYYIDTLYNLRLQYPKSHPMNYIAKLLLNSLYGRFGMEDSFTDISILNPKAYEKFEKNHSSGIKDAINLGNKILVEHRADILDINTLLDNASETHNVSIPIAAAVTAYARIHMSIFKNNPNFNLYYTDTDSAYIDRPLPHEMISNTILGKMKLENILTDAIFLAPKLYCLVTEEGKIIHKVKGLNHNIDLNMNDFEQLLYKDSFIEKSQTKWRKTLSEGHIRVLNELYTIKVTENKRKLIYDENNKLVCNVPYIIDKNKMIKT